MGDGALTHQEREEAQSWQPGTAGPTGVRVCVEGVGEKT